MESEISRDRTARRTMTEDQARDLARMINIASGMGDIVVPDQLGNRSWGVRLLAGAWIYTTIDQVPDVGHLLGPDFGAAFHSMVGD
jgi:hypothetical protein